MLLEPTVLYCCYAALALSLKSKKRRKAEPTSDEGCDRPETSEFAKKEANNNNSNMLLCWFAWVVVCFAFVCEETVTNRRRNMHIGAWFVPWHRMAQAGKAKRNALQVCTCRTSMFHGSCITSLLQVLFCPTSPLFCYMLGFVTTWCSCHAACSVSETTSEQSQQDRQIDKCAHGQADTHRRTQADS
jgi:hypothetical protein